MYQVVMYNINPVPLYQQTPPGIKINIKYETLEEALIIADEKKDIFHRVYVWEQASAEKIVHYEYGRIII